jgi:hypothetical protein
MKIQAIALIATLILLAGCSSKPAPIVVDTRPTARPPLVIQPVDPIVARKVEWIIVTPENVETVFEQLRTEGKDIVLFALTDDGYKDMSLNLADIQKLVRQQRSIIVAYERYYKNEDKTE